MKPDTPGVFHVMMLLLLLLKLMFYDNEAGLTRVQLLAHSQGTANALAMLCMRCHSIVDVNRCFQTCCNLQEWRQDGKIKAGGRRCIN